MYNVLLLSMRMSKKLEFFFFYAGLIRFFFLVLFLYFFSPLLLLLAFPLHIPSASPNKFGVDYDESLEMES